MSNFGCLLSVVEYNKRARDCKQGGIKHIEGEKDLFIIAGNKFWSFLCIFENSIFYTRKLIY